MQSRLADLVARLAVKARPGLKRKLPGAMVVEVEGQLCLKVPATRGMFTLVDIEDAEMVLSRCWQARPGRNTWYASSDFGTHPDWIKIFLHRKILQCLPGTQVDHINGDGLDNRKKNLRLSTQSQNLGNSRLSRASTSGFKGVYWNKGKGRWTAEIGRGEHSRHAHLGHFHNIYDAARAYNAAAIAKWGEFARLNTLPETITTGEKKG